MPRWYNEMMRQADSIEEGKRWKQMQELFDEYKSEFPNEEHDEKQRKAFFWLWEKLNPKTQDNEQ